MGLVRSRVSCPHMVRSLATAAVRRVNPRTAVASDTPSAARASTYPVVVVKRPHHSRVLALDRDPRS